MIGQTLAHYKITEKIGSGGMGDVYRARDQKLDRDVALKVLPADVASDPGRLERFEREAKSIAALNHPNIVTIYAVEEADGVHVLVMELIEGESLDRRITPEGLPLAKIFDIATPVADALATAHDKGIIHRDLKPANVMITREGRIKVLDFGLAKLAMDAGADSLTAAPTRQAETTSEGTVLGTLPYMSPEQVRGLPVDHRSDIFSLGVMLYELATGRRPFAGDTSSDLISSILRDEPRAPTDRRDDLPRHLGRIIHRCLEKDPERRYQSAKDVRNELELLRKEVDSGASDITSKTGQEEQVRIVAAPKSDPGRAIPSTPRTGTGAGRALRFAIPAAVIVVAIAILLLLQPFGDGSDKQNVAMAGDQSLAIMYFENVIDPEDPQRLGSITTSLLIADLSESQYVSVVSSQRLRDILSQLGHGGDSRMDPALATQVATRAGAKWMLMGTILRTEPTMLVTSELVDVESGQVAASQRIVGNEDDEIFDIVDRLTVEVKRDLALPTEAMTERDRDVADMTSHSREAYRLYMEGVELFHELRTAEAGKKMEQALAIDSTFAPAWLRLGLVNFFPARGILVGKHIDRAVQYAEGAGRLDRAYIDAFAAASGGDDERAVEILGQAQQLFPNEKELYLFLGTIKAFRMNDAPGGIAALERVVAMDPSYKVAWNYLAYVYARRGDREKSKAALERYMTLVPDEANPYDTGGDLYFVWGDLETAAEMYETALTKAAFVPWSIRKLGATYLAMGEYAKATQQFRRMAASESPSDRVAGWVWMAFPHIWRGQYDDGLETLDRAIAIGKVELGDELSFWPEAVRASTLWEHGEHERALEAMQMCAERLRRGEGSERFEHLWVKMLVQSGQFEQAKEVAAALRLVTIGDNVSQRCYYDDAMGHIALARGRYDEAITHFKTGASHTAPDNAGWAVLRLDLALAFIEAKRYAEAIDVYDATLERTPSLEYIVVEHVNGYYYLGLAYENTGDRRKAIENYERFLDIRSVADPGVPLVDDARQRLERLRAGS